MSVSTSDQLMPYLEPLLARVRDARGPVFAVAGDGGWDGPEQLFVAGRYVDVRWCPSELAVREVLLEPVEPERALVVLTPGPRLADDVVARLTIRKLIRPNPLDALAAAFDVRSIDPAIPSWLVRRLVAIKPPDGYERTGAQLLDLSRAWDAYLTHGLGLDPDESLGGLLAWAQDERAERLVDAVADERDAAVAHLSATMLGASGVLAAVLAGRGPDATALGLALRVLADGPDGATRVEGRVRAEHALGGWSFDERAARAWADAAERALSRLTEIDEPAAHAVLHRADRVVDDLHAGDLAGTSAMLASGLRRRLVALAHAIDAAVGIEEAAARVAAHRLSVGGAAEVATLAQRLRRWLATEPSTPRSLVEGAQEYAASIAYADLARTRLRHGGGEPTLDEALRRLVAAADERRNREEEHFARALRDWAAHSETNGGLIGVEDVLETFVAPLARSRPTLVIVLDGMSHRVASELLEDAVRGGWTELRRADHPERALVLAALPSVTTYSRSSLLAGQLCTGLAREETAAFASHPALLAAVGNGEPPLLFHKGQLGDERGGLARTVRDEVAGDRRIVGAVVNAIDDHLARSEQLRSPWSTRDILPLRWLLEAARDAGRLVVLVSDHGHVLERGGQQRAARGEGGERWRAATRTPTDGEVLVEGPRVLTAGSALLVWDERVRFSPPKHGYHGGATAQEVLAPAIVLTPAPTDGVEGWTEAAYDPPAWWTGVDPAEVPAVPEPPAAPEPRPGQQLSLDAPATGGWIAALLASDTLAAQRPLAARTPLDDARIAAILSALDARGNTMLRPALAQACGLSPMRLNGILAALRLLLNVDGYSVLEVDDASDTVRLNLPLLEEQFGLER